MAPRRAILLLFLLFICGSFQDGNFTSLAILASTTNLTANVVVVVTLHHRQSDQVNHFAEDFTSTPPNCPTTRTVLHTRASYQPTTLPSAGSSNSSALEDEFALNLSQAEADRSDTDATIETTFHATNNNGTVIEQASSNNPNETCSRKRPMNQATEPDNYPRNDTRSPTDLADLWVAHQRRSTKARKPLWRAEHDPPPKLPIFQPAPIGLAALTAGTLYLAKDKRRKRQKTHEQEKKSTTSSVEPSDFIRQPETRPISQELLVAEVKGIYAGLVMVEAKCIEVDNKYAAHTASESPPALANEQWQALIALHRALLHEHHDFFLASQHPSATPALRRLASRYAMPARMWRHGIHSFLELMRHRLPESLDHMIAFIGLAYTMMALLYETVPAFEDTWIECLGDLGRYRMAIEDDDIRDREILTGVARHWYSKASDGAPTTGRLYHHLAVLTRPNALAQLFYYSKSVCTSLPFASTPESILTLFDPVFNASVSSYSGLPPLDLAFVKAHGVLFKRKTLQGFEPPAQEFIATLDNNIARLSQKFLEQGYHIAITNSVAMLGFGSKDNPLMEVMESLPEKFEDSEVLPSNHEFFCSARKLAHETLEIALRRLRDPNVLPLIHVSLAFMHLICRYAPIQRLVQIDFPWESLVNFLNVLLDSYDTSSGTIAEDTFPISIGTDFRPFPEDFAMRGLLWAENYFPSEWFSGEFDLEDKAVHFDAMTPKRKERILWLAVHITKKFPTTINFHPASYNPRRNELNKPHFSANMCASSAGSSSNATEISESSCEVDLASPSFLSLELKQSTTYPSIDDDPRFNGFHATLALPLDPSQESLDGYLGTSRASSEALSYMTKGSPETLETWLSDMTNLDTLDDGDKIEGCQTEADDDQNKTGCKEKLLSYMNAAVPDDLVVFCHAGNDDHEGKDAKDLTENPRSNEQGNKDDQEQPDSEKKEGQCLLRTPKIKDSSKLSPTTPSNTSPLDSECSLDRPIESPLPLSANSFPQNTSSTYPIPKASGSPLSSTSTPNPSKPHVCSHCQKAFARISDMNKHIKYHTKPISCQIPNCDYTCGRQKDLSRHQHGFHKEIYGEEEFPCPFEECKEKGVKFSRKDNLGRHLRKKHGDSDGHEGASPP